VNVKSLIFLTPEERL